MSEKNKGILCILGSAFFFALMGLFVRLAGDLPTPEKAFFRNAVAAIIAFIAVRKDNISLAVPKGARGDLLARSVCGTIGIFGNFYAIAYLNLADANMLNNMSPFWSIVLSVPLLRERFRPRQFVLVCCAFAGAMLVLKPTGTNLQLIPSLAGFLGGFGAGMAYTLVRRLSLKGVRGPVIVFYFSLFSSLVAALLTVRVFVMPTLQQLGILLLCGAAAAFGQFLVTAAYGFAPAREISVYNYASVLFSALMGMLFFAQLPDGLSLVGYIVIITMAVLNYRYNRRTIQE